MICTKCNNQQESGQFCGNCGNQLNPANQMATEESASTTQNFHQQATVQGNANEQFDKVKTTSKQYGAFFLNYLKNPSDIIQNPAGKWGNGIITLFIFTLIFSLSVYRLFSVFTAPSVRSFGSFMGGRAVTGPSFFSIFFSILIVTIILVAISTISMFVINQVFGPKRSFVDIFTIYSVHFVPAIVVMVVAWLLLLLKSLALGSFLMTVVFTVMIFIVPLYLISCYLNEHSHRADRYYSFVCYLLLFGFLFYVTSAILIDSTLGEYMGFLTRLL